MAKCVYFFDKVTGKIIGMNSHAEKDPDTPGLMRETDANIIPVWEDVKTGKLWPFILDKVTDKKSENLDYIEADVIQSGFIAVEWLSGPIP